MTIYSQNVNKKNVNKIPMSNGGENTPKWKHNIKKEQKAALRTAAGPCKQTIVKFADDTTMVRLISKEDEAAYRKVFQNLSTWCSDDNLALNTNKTKEIIVDFNDRTDPPPLYINGECVERVHTFRFLGVQFPDDLSWTANTTAVIMKAQQRLLRVLRKNNLDRKLLLAFYRSSI